MHNKSSSSVSE